MCECACSVKYLQRFLFFIRPFTSTAWGTIHKQRSLDFSLSYLAVLLRYVHPIIVEFELNLIIQLNFWSQLLYRRFPIPYLSFIVISTCFHFLQMHLSEKMIFHLEMVILHKNMKILDTIQKLVCKLGMKTHMHLPIGNHFLLYHVIIRPNKIKDPLKDCKSSIFKIRYFLKMCPIFASSLHSIGR